MARGQDEKNSVINKILETFDGSFLYNNGKEIRVPVKDVQIKIVLSCAKENVAAGADLALPGAEDKTSVTVLTENEGFKELEPTKEEKEKVESLLSSLGMM